MGQPIDFSFFEDVDHEVFLAMLAVSAIFLHFLIAPCRKGHFNG